MNTLEARDAPAATANLKQVNKIVVAVDLTPHSEATADYAAQFAQVFGAAITLAHVCRPEPVNQLIATPEVFTAPERQREIAKGALGRLVQRVRNSCPSCEGKVLVGDPAERLTGLARATAAGLIVVGSRHAHLLDRLFGQSLAAQLVCRAPCPVLVYRDDTHERAAI